MSQNLQTMNVKNRLSRKHYRVVAKNVQRKLSLLGRSSLMHRKREAVHSFSADAKGETSQSSALCNSVIPLCPAPLNYVSNVNSSLSATDEDQNTYNHSNIQCINSTTFLKNGNMLSFNEKLSRWAIENDIPLSSLGKLLLILCEKLPNLPKDPRTLLKTPTRNVIKGMGTGSYYYFGISTTLARLCSKYNVKLSRNDVIELSVNIDGLPLSKSTGSSFWPILGMVKSSVTQLDNKVFLISLYHGSSKPSPNSFLEDFVNESIELINNGLTAINDITCGFRVRMLICDAPAKSYILSVKGHSGYFSCTKCTQEGDLFDNFVCFTEANYINRTDLEFRNKTQPEHHTGTTLLENIPNFNLIDNIPLDYMHLSCLGVMKRLLCHKRYGWIFGKPPFKVRARTVQNLNDLLIKYNKYIPTEFSRKTRTLNEAKRYKATEFRLFLLYVGPVVLKKAMPTKYYRNFVCLSVATSILISKEYSVQPNFIDYAEKLLKIFVTNCKDLYGPGFLSHNVHNLLHLVDCVRMFGPLDNFSAFPFENFMQTLKRKVHTHSKPLEQVIRRVIEDQNTRTNIIRDNSEHQNLILNISHSGGPLLPECTFPQFKILKTCTFLINVSRLCDRFVELYDETVLEVRNFATSYSGQTVLIGIQYERVDDLFSKPCASRLINISCIESINETLVVFDIKLIKKKLLILPFENKLVSLPLLHNI